MNSSVSVAVVDTYPLFREGVTQTLVQRGLTVLATGETAADACRIAEEMRPDILILDINVSGNGLDAARVILQRQTNVKIVVLTAFDDDEHVGEALSAGVQGYILKGVSGSELVHAIAAIHAGEPYITPALASRILVQRRSIQAQERTAANCLTQREKEVLHYLARGLTNSEIALELGVTVRCTKYLLAMTYKKMRVRNRVAAVLEVQKMGLHPGGSR